MPEFNESQSKWLGGVFEAGGSLYFDIQTKKRGKPFIYSSPNLSFSDNNHQKVSLFKQMVGGGQVYTKRGSSELRIGGRFVDLAVEIAHQMAPYAPMRQKDIAAFELWGEIDDKSEKLLVALESRKIERVYPSIDEYAELVKMPEFMAGVIDARGLTYPKNQLLVDADRISYGLKISDQNKPLLDAIEGEYGGSVQLELAQGQEKQGVIIARDTYVLYIVSAEADPLVESARPYLLTGKVNGEL